jgi:hypothetical protein
MLGNVTKDLGFAPILWHCLNNGKCNECFGTWSCYRPGLYTTRKECFLYQLLLFTIKKNKEDEMWKTYSIHDMGRKI